MLNQGSWDSDLVSGCKKMTYTGPVKGSRSMPAGSDPHGLERAKLEDGRLKEAVREYLIGSGLDSACDD